MVRYFAFNQRINQAIHWVKQSSVEVVWVCAVCEEQGDCVRVGALQGHSKGRTSVFVVDTVVGRHQTGMRFF